MGRRLSAASHRGEDRLRAATLERLHSIVRAAWVEPVTLLTLNDDLSSECRVDALDGSGKERTDGVTYWPAETLFLPPGQFYLTVQWGCHLVPFGTKGGVMVEMTGRASRDYIIWDYCPRTTTPLPYQMRFYGAKLKEGEGMAMPLTYPGFRMVRSGGMLVLVSTVDGIACPGLLAVARA